MTDNNSEAVSPLNHLQGNKTAGIPDGGGKSPTIGSALRNERRKQNLTLEMVHNATKIPAKFIQALEDDAQDAGLPAPIFVKGFIKSYCELLNLDFDRLWEEHHPKPLKTEEEPESAPREQSERNSFSVNSKIFIHYANEIIPQSFSMPHPGITGLAAALIFAGLLWLWRTPPLSVAMSNNTGAIAHTLAEGTIQLPGSQLKAVFKKKTWIKVEADRKIVFEGYAPKDAALEWKSLDNYFTVMTADPENVLLFLSGRQVSPEKIKKGTFIIP